MILALESTNTTTDNNDTNDGDTNRMCTKNGGKVAGDCNDEGVSVNSSAGIIFSSAKQQRSKQISI